MFQDADSWPANGRNASRTFPEKLSAGRLDTYEKRLIFVNVKFTICSLSDAFRRAMQPTLGNYPYNTLFLRFGVFRTAIGGCGCFENRRA